MEKHGVVPVLVRRNQGILKGPSYWEGVSRVKMQQHDMYTRP